MKNKKITLGFVLTAISTVLAIVCCFLYKSVVQQNSTTYTLLIFAAIAGVSFTWFHDVNFQKELAMNRAIEEGDWERVLDVARDGSTDVRPTRQIVMYKNLALFRLGHFQFWRAALIVQALVDGDRALF